MQIITALMNLDQTEPSPAHRIVAGMVFLVLLGTGSSKVDYDDHSDYANASWHPSNVNHDE